MKEFKKITTGAGNYYFEAADGERIAIDGCKANGKYDRHNGAVLYGQTLQDGREVFLLAAVTLSEPDSVLLVV